MQHRADFLRQIPHRVAVCPVWRQTDIQNRIVQSQVFQNPGFTHRRFVIKNVNAVQLFFRLGFFIHAQLRQAADHAVGFHPAHLGRFNFKAAGQHSPDLGYDDFLSRPDIRRAADDIQHFVADIDRRDVQMIAVGVVLTGQNLTDDQIRAFGHFFDAFDFQSGNR